MTVLPIVPWRLGQISQGSHATEYASLCKTCLLRACLVLNRRLQPLPNRLLLVENRGRGVVVHPPLLLLLLLLLDGIVVRVVVVTGPIDSFVLLGRGCLLRRARKTGARRSDPRRRHFDSRWVVRVQLRM